MLSDSLSFAQLLADSGALSSLISNIGLWAQVALGIGFVIFVHELGHFVAAKTFGVKCEKFYVGFDVPIRIGPIKFPRTFGKFTYGETEYGIGIIPLGGYVKMLGQDDDPRKMEEENKRIQVDSDDAEETAQENVEPQLDPRSYPAKPVWQRMIIISAGVVMNVVTGFLFAALAFGFGVEYQPAIVGGVTPGGPSWQAGIEPGGKVIAVGEYQNDEMHFREMRSEIFNAGIANPDAPVPMTIRYDNGVRQVELPTQSQREEAIIRLVGISSPLSTNLSDQPDKIAEPGSVADEVFTAKDAGAKLVAFNGTPIDEDSIVPATPLLDHLYSHPAEPVTLTLERTTGSTRQVVLPPQKAKTLGLKYTVGPIVALVNDGPAAAAGMQVGDVIVGVGENESPDPFEMAVDLVAAGETIQLTVLRNGEEVDLAVTPTDALQTVPPTQSIGGEIAINSVGFAYQPLPKISEISGTTQPVDGGSLQLGDEVQQVTLILGDGEQPEWLEHERFERAFGVLREGWTISAETPLTVLRETIQALPVGTQLRVHATRPPEGRVITSILTVQPGDEYLFERGLGIEPTELVQRAGSATEALTLGIAEGSRRFQEVLRFLASLPTGRIKLRHVGGPVEIVNIAKNRAEEGISPQLMFLTLLSMNLAILNFLPIPALDGGHMVFLIYELIVGKRANEQVEFGLTVFGLLTLLTLMVVVFANDILRHMN